MNDPISNTMPPRRKIASPYLSLGLVIISIVVSTVVTYLTTVGSADNSDGASFGLYVFGVAFLGYIAGLAFAIVGFTFGIIATKRKMRHYGVAIAAIVVGAYYISSAQFIVLLFYSGQLLTSLT